MAVRIRAIYSGRVQGVGFRATARTLARSFAVDGWVRNLPDGTVELAVEGDRAEAERFLAALGERMADEIAHTTTSDETPQGETGFRVRP